MSCILTRPTRSPKYGVIRNNIPRYYTLNRPRKYIYFYTASQSFRILSENCTFRHILRLFILFRRDRSGTCSGMEKSSWACNMSFIQWCCERGPKSHVAKEILGREERSSLRKHPFLLAFCRWGRFTRRNVCDSATEIPYWWRKSMFT